jgi:hypothetical protein
MSSTYKILYCSSESTDHPANALLSDEIWQTNGYVREAILEIGFDKPTQITKIELGNAGCAFVEVLVTNREDPQESSDYQVLLPIVNLMSYSESKNATVQARTRRYVWTSSDKLKPEVCAQSWRRVRFVCKQIFNTDLPIGLSLLRINPMVANGNVNVDNKSAHIMRTKSSVSSMRNKAEKETIEKIDVSPETQSKPEVSNGATEKGDIKADESSKKYSKKIVVPMLDLKKETSLSNSSSQSELFRMLKPPTTFAELKAKIKAEETSQKNITDNVAVAHKHQPASSTFKDTTQSHSSQKITKEKTKTSVCAVSQVSQQKNSKSTLTPSIVEERSSQPQPQTKSKRATATTKSSSTLTTSHSVPYSQIMNGVVAVISGIPLPERATIRDNVIAMGGAYSPTWHDGCTHLITAFSGTPKYRQALAAGAYIVTKHWVYQSSQQKTRLAETHFKLSATADSDDQLTVGTGVTTKKSKKEKKNSDEEFEGPNEYDFTDGFLVGGDVADDTKKVQKSGSDKPKSSVIKQSKEKTMRSVLSLEEDDLDTIREAQEWLQNDTASNTKLKRVYEDKERAQSSKKLKITESNEELQTLSQKSK